MKTIGVVAMREDTGIFFKTQLDSLFEGEIKVNRYALGSTEEKISIQEEELLVFASQDSYSEKDRKMQFSCPTILANRSLNYKFLGEMFEIPEGSEVYVLNDFQASAYDSIKQFNALGFNQFRYIPFYPGAKGDGKRRVLIAFGGFDGRYDQLPRNIEKIIDVGIRTIDISTIVEIMLRVGLPKEKVYQITAKYVQDIIFLAKEISHLSNDNAYMRKKLETVVQTVTDGIVVLDSKNGILTFNTAAKKMFHLEGSPLSGERVSMLPEKLVELFSHIGVSEDSENGLYSYNGKNLDISMYKVGGESGAGETIFLVREVTEIQKLEQKLRVKLAQKRYISRYTFSDILGTSNEIQVLKKTAQKMAQFDHPVYIYGESGTGKELFAQAIHAASKRAGGPFVAVNFAALPESLLESELFGYAEGAFTGAKKGGMPGVFEQAHGGTLFLDEIGDAPLSFQIRLLRVLQEKQVRRIGDDKLIPVDVRIIVATNRDIAQLVQDKKFREDLYYRLNVLPLHLLPLRDRREDIIPLAKVFYEEATEGLAEMPRFEEFFGGKQKELLCHSFPGNARQLRNVVEYLVCTADAGKCPDIALAFGELPAGRDRCGDKELILEMIRSRAAGGMASGRRSLAEALAISEDRVKRALEQLKKEGVVQIHKGRRGVTLSEGNSEE